jgi:hypothetical protein
MWRVHRSFSARFKYLAIFRCRLCDREEYALRPHRLHFGKHARCPQCGTFRIIKLEKPDRIDRMQTGLLNLLEKLAGGSVYSCCFCRLQFYDRRRMAPKGTRQRAAEPAAALTNPPDMARTDE